MICTDRLVAEHDTILRGLILLDKQVQKLEAGGDVPEAFVKWVPSFLHEFADVCHHAKEEDVLFPALEARGLPRHGGPIGVMLHEHTLGRECVQRMREASEPLDGAAFAAAAAEFIALLRQHIAKENEILFRMADSLLGDADDDLVKQFDATEAERGLVALAAKYTSELDRWERELA